MFGRRMLYGYPNVERRAVWIRLNNSTPNVPITFKRTHRKDMAEELIRTTASPLTTS